MVGDVAEAEQQLQRIRDAGVPNYFGSQRFGRGGQNLRRAMSCWPGVVAAVGVSSAA